ncbi:MAG: hypothetical protein OXG82_18935 [Gammaproteobacteria bacterium]|nr:hypothetical protein [Gammaproteobacteria bacterium]
MAEDILPLKGTIANLNWFDRQRKHYETPDQIARRFRLPDDAGMRAFCGGAAAVQGRDTVQFIRRAPGTPDGTWSSLFADPANAALWLFGVDWELRPDGKFELPQASEGMAREGRITELEPGRLVALSSPSGGVTRFEMQDASGSARARRDVPNYAGPITEFRLTDRVPEGAGVPDQLHETTSERIAQPGGAGTHCVGVVADWHRAATLFQQLAFAEAKQYWPPELAVGLDLEALVAAYAKLLAAYHAG